MTELLVSRVRPWGAEAVDILIRDGRIASVVPAGTPASTAPRFDGRGLLALPGFINAHAHVDKSWWGKPWVTPDTSTTTAGRIAFEREHRDELGLPDLDSTVAVLREFLRHGTTAVRSHVDVDLGVGFRGIETVREAVARLDHAIDIEIVAFPQDGILRRPGVLALLDDIAQRGVSVIGGLDPAGIDRDPVAQLDGIFAIAERRGVGLDIHLHDGGELGAFQIELIAERTRALGLRGRVPVSHGFALGQLGGERQRELLDLLAESGVGWATAAPVSSAPLPWREMRERGIPLGLGTDGIRDLWSPFGDGDMLRRALQFVQLHRLRQDADLVAAVDVATRGAASFVGRAVHDLVEGSVADIVLIDAENVPDALVRAPRRAAVFSKGVLVAENDEVLVRTAP